MTSDGKEQVGVNVSLTPELAQNIQERVKSGLYGSASDVVREALRLLERLGPESDRRGNEELPALAESDWRELREALLSGESFLLGERAREIGELFEAGLALARARIAADHPGASTAMINKHLAQWLRERAGADVGDGPGRPVSHERLRRILDE